ncbi:copper-binding protein [Nocardia speluncae]|uniref:Copper-binding protein n=1 Tax=Nocardia speluncae TaxID=419477 RepID=A0A846XG21_9NOCA|nr:cupredoxin domain-containing protein [Nocardia speluncae]NKY34315.1 copper-binding protein [Nocardia speluncae]
MPRPHRAASAAVAGLTLVAALLAGCGSDESTPTRTDTSITGSHRNAEATVSIFVEDDAFSPAEITITAGDTVAWHFDGDIPHGVQGIGDKAMGLNSPLFEVGDWSYTFTSPGEYRYLCPIHPDMRGKVIVEEA